MLSSHWAMDVPTTLVELPLVSGQFHICPSRRTRRLLGAEAVAVSIPRLENPDKGRQEEGEVGLGQSWHREGQMHYHASVERALEKVAIRRDRALGRRRAQRHLCAGLGYGPEQKKEPAGDESH